MTPTSYFCTKCDFAGSSMSAWGSFTYKIDEHFEPINRVIGICYNCNAITPVEKIPDAEYLNRLKKDSILDMLNENVKKCLELFTHRKSEARCLDCGSHNFNFIPNALPKNKINYSGKPWQTGLIHKNCGGEIHAHFTSTNFYMGDMLPKRFYSIEGIEITSPS